MDELLTARGGVRTVCRLHAVVLGLDPGELKLSGAFGWVLSVLHGPEAWAGPDHGTARVQIFLASLRSPGAVSFFSLVQGGGPWFIHGFFSLDRHLSDRNKQSTSSSENTKQQQSETSHHFNTLIRNKDLKQMLIKSTRRSYLE